jgi:hypothetical protein
MLTVLYMKVPTIKLVWKCTGGVAFGPVAQCMFLYTNVVLWSTPIVENNAKVLRTYILSLADCLSDEVNLGKIGMGPLGLEQSRTGHKPLEHYMIGSYGLYNDNVTVARLLLDQVAI